METTTLSGAAMSLLHECVNAEANPRVDASNLEAYRELAEAGVMYPVSTFKRGPESVFRFTEGGWADRHRILARTAGSPAASS
jgi:hypothetical protein